jgi:hypothetical protein
MEISPLPSANTFNPFALYRFKRLGLVKWFVEEYNIEVDTINRCRTPSLSFDYLLALLSSLDEVTLLSLVPTFLHITCSFGSTPLFFAVAYFGRFDGS